MTIAEIKEKLSLSAVLAHYGLEADRNGMLHCPFHEDKTPSFQVYLKTSTWTCFSTACTAGSGDMIDLIMKKENLTKHQAILKAKELCGEMPAQKPAPVPQKLSQADRIRLLARCWGFYAGALKQTKAAQEYVKQRSIGQAEAGFNSGRLHYRGGISPEELQGLVSLGLISGAASGSSYRSFAKDCIFFALRDKENNIVSLYGRSINPSTGSGQAQNQRHYYLKDRQGLYPSYPKAETRTLILTESVIDAATLAQHYPAEHTAVLACYGTNGLSEEHLAAIHALPELNEIVLFFDGDQAGVMATEKYARELSQLLKVSISRVNTPDGQDINSLVSSHDPQILAHLIETRTALFLSIEKKESANPSPEAHSDTDDLTGTLNTESPDCLVYSSSELLISIWGGIELHNPGRLKVSLHVRSKTDRYKTYRDEVNLYSHQSTEKLIRNLASSLELSTTSISKTIADLTEQLEEYRNQERAKQKQLEIEAADKELEMFTDRELKAGLDFLRQPGLMEKTQETIGNIGLVGEEKNGLLLFFILLTRLFKDPLHALIQGKSGSGKTHLLKRVASLIPKAHLETVTALSENTLYHSGKDYWKHKILLIEDLDGAYNALLPLREFMSNQSIRKLSTASDPKSGEHSQKWLYAEGPVCVAGATTKERIYEDNANRSFLVQVDESPEHTDKVLDYQRKTLSGLLERTHEEKLQTLFKAAQVQLAPIEVKIPFGASLRIPQEVFKKLRTNTHYLTLIKAIAFWHQRQREIRQTGEGKHFIEATLEDVAWANELSKEVLLRKSDELNGALRGFFESLKTQLKASGQESFYARPVRERLRMNPMQVSRYLNELEQRGYIRQSGGNRKTGYEYNVKIWDDYESLKAGIGILDEVLKGLKVKYNTSITAV